jgi:hypothetical protein
MWNLKKNDLKVKELLGDEKRKRRRTREGRRESGYNQSTISAHVEMP